MPPKRRRVGIHGLEREEREGQDEFGGNNPERRQGDNIGNEDIINRLMDMLQQQHQARMAQMQQQQQVHMEQIRQLIEIQQKSFESGSTYSSSSSLPGTSSMSMPVPQKPVSEGFKRPRAGPVISRPAGGSDKVLCSKCGRQHKGECLKGSKVCYRCREPGHLAVNCPQRSGMSQTRAPARVYVMTASQSGYGASGSSVSGQRGSGSPRSRVPVLVNMMTQEQTGQEDTAVICGNSFIFAFWFTL